MATLTETWEPANHLEHQLREALRTGDQDAYFAALSVAELLIPLSNVEPGAPQPGFIWPTSTRDGRTHVLAYTSAESARACLGPGYEHFARMPLAEIAQSWPDAEWWLAVDSGLPIEGYLPAWFIGQLTERAVPQPQRARERQEPAPDPNTAPPLHDPSSTQDPPPRFPAVTPPGEDAPPPATPPATVYGHGAAPPAPGAAPRPPRPEDVSLPGSQAGEAPRHGQAPVPYGHVPPVPPVPHGQAPAPHGGPYGPPRHGEATHPPQHDQIPPVPRGETPYGEPAPPPQHAQATPPPPSPAEAPPAGDTPPPGHPQDEAPPAPHGDLYGPPHHGEATHPPQHDQIPPVPRGETPYGEPAPPPYGEMPAAHGERPPARHGRPPAPPQGEVPPAPYTEMPLAQREETPPESHGEPSPGPYGETPPSSPPPGESPPPPPSYGERPPTSTHDPVPATEQPTTEQPARRPGPLGGAVPPATVAGGASPVAETRPQPPVSDADPMPPVTPGAPLPTAPLHDATPYGAPPGASPSDQTPTPPSDPPPYDTPPASHQDTPGRPSEAPISLHLTDGADFVPLDEEERALYEAALRGDRAEFLRILLGVRQIWVPMVEGRDLMLGPGRPGFEWYIQEHEGHVTVPLFTGPSRMREAMGGHPFVLSDLAKVFRFWPDTSWDLVVNVGSPIGASISGDRITALSQEVDAGAAARLAHDFPAQNDAERRLFEHRDDPDLMVQTLLGTSVFLPVWSRNPPTVQTPPDDPAFPWSAVPVRGRMAVPIFTSFDWMREAVGTTGFVMPTFADLLATWPEPGWSVSVNTGTPIEVTLSGEQIRALGDSIAKRPAGPSAPPPAVIAPPAEPAPIASAPIEDAPGGPGGTPRGDDGTGAAPGGPAEAPRASAEAPAAPGEATRPTREAARSTGGPAGQGTPGIWTIMQKVVPPAQVPWYLDKAYDRVAGFVHRVRDVTDLGTPRQLYEALGLLRDGSPFGPDDQQVHVIRWPAYRPSLYRVPFGGTAEEVLKTWGEDGWVVEPPPFQGDGFAPGSGGSIPEYKVDSLRLPHGSEMYVIGSDGSERFLARFDADRFVWGDTS